MITPEQYIADLERQVSSLTEELSQSQRDCKEFEDLAKEWKKGYFGAVKRYQIEIGNLEQEIEELKKEIDAIDSGPES